SIGFTVTAGRLIKLAIIVLRKINGNNAWVEYYYNFKRNNTAGNYGTAAGNPVVSDDLIISHDRLIKTFQGNEVSHFFNVGDISSSSIEDYVNIVPDNTYVLLDNATVYYFECIKNGENQTYKYVGYLPVTFGQATALVTDFDLIAGAAIPPAPIPTPTEQQIIGDIYNNVAATGTLTLDLSLYAMFNIGMTGNTTIVETNAPTTLKTFIRQYRVTGLHTFTRPGSWVALPNSEAYDGTKINLYTNLYFNIGGTLQVLFFNQYTT